MEWDLPREHALATVLLHVRYEFLCELTFGVSSLSLAPLVELPDLVDEGAPEVGVQNVELSCTEEHPGPVYDLLDRIREKVRVECDDRWGQRGRVSERGLRYMWSW